MGSSSLGVVGKAGGHWPGYGDQTIARIPSICPCAIAQHVAVGIIGDAGAVPVRKLVGTVVGGIGHWRRQVGTRQAAADSRAVADRVVGIVEIAEGCGAVVVGDAGELRDGVVAISSRNAARERERRSTAGGVVRKRHVLAALCNLGEPVGVVVRVIDRGLTSHGHIGAPAIGVVAVTHGALGGGFRGQAVKAVVGAGDSAAHAVNRLHQAARRVVRGRYRGPVGKAGMGAAVEGVKFWMRQSDTPGRTSLTCPPRISFWEQPNRESFTRALPGYAAKMVEQSKHSQGAGT